MSILRKGKPLSDGASIIRPQNLDCPVLFDKNSTKDVIGNTSEKFPTIIEDRQ